MEKVELFEMVVERLQDEGYDASVHEGYSGRGMFGDTVPGISTSASGVIVGYTITRVAMELEIEPADFLPGRRDSLGLGTIYY